MARAKSARRSPLFRILGTLLAVLVVLAIVVFVGSRLFGVNFVGFLSPGGVAAVTVPDGFKVHVFASGLSAPRLMTVGADGTLFVTEQGAGRVTALPDRNGDGQADDKINVAADLNRPQSLSFLGADLLVGEEDRISKLTLGADLRSTNRTTLIPDLPTDGVHTSKTVLVGSDGRVYVAMGSTCNACQEGDKRRAAVSVYSADGGAGTVFASGLRNAVGLALNPVNNEIWASNNGRDLMGDDTPPETVYALQEDGNYGWPGCHSGEVIDPQFGNAGSCDSVVAPLVKMQAHMAPLGIAFYSGTQFPEAYRNSLFIALHGSWNRTESVGYKVMRVPLKDGQVAGEAEDFATGWRGAVGQIVGRPAGIAVAADGSLLVSDDKAGLIYRISYGQ